MEIKTIYLDLKEGPQYAKKNKDVWILKSEAFKDPLKFKMEYNPSELQRIEDVEKSCWEAYNEIGILKQNLEDKIELLDNKIKNVENIEKQLSELKTKYDDNYQALKDNEKVISDGNKSYVESIESLKGGITKLGDKIDQIRQFQPYIYYKNEFIASDQYFITIDIPAGNYIVIDQREYIGLNKNTKDYKDLQFYQIITNGGYNFEVNLETENDIDPIAADCIFNVLFFKL